MEPKPAVLCDPYPPARPDGTSPTFSEAWRTEIVLTLAYGIRADGAFDRMPILADALEEMGCDDPIVLTHCRLCERHQRECWVIEGLLPSDRLHWTGEVQERLAAAVAAAARQGHPDDPDVIPGRVLRQRVIIDEAEAEARQAERDRLMTRVVWGCASAVVFVALLPILLAVLNQVFRT